MEKSVCHFQLGDVNVGVQQLMGKVNKNDSFFVRGLSEELINCATVWSGTGVPGRSEASRCAVSSL